MFCCGGADEEPAGPPANQYSSAPPNKAGNNNFGGNKSLTSPHPSSLTLIPYFVVNERLRFACVCD